MVAAKLRVRSRLRVLFRLRCKSTRSFASLLEAPLREQTFTASVLKATLREQSFTASVCERIWTFECACTEVTNTLAHARTETLHTLALKLRARSQWKWCNFQCEYSKLPCESNVSLQASISVFEPSSALAPKSQIRSHTLALKLCTRSHWNFAHAHGENGAVFNASVLQATLREQRFTASKH